MNRFLLIFLFSVVHAFAQKPSDDALKNKSKQKGAFEKYNELAWKYVNKDPDSLYYFNELSKKYIENEEQKGKYIVLTGVDQFIQGDFDKASQLVYQSMQLAVKTKDYKTISSGYAILSKIKNMEGNFEESERLSKIALDNILKTKNNPAILKAIINYGSTLIQNNKYEEGIKYYKLGEQYFYKGSEYEQGILLMNLGSTFVVKKEYQNALPYLEKSEQLLLLTKAESLYYKCYENFSEAYVGLNNKSKAEYYLAKAAQYSPGEAYMTHINYIYARLYYQFRDYSKAKHYLQQSIATDEKLNASNLGEDYILMAEILNASGSYTDADAYLHRAISIFKKNNEEENLKISYDLILKNYFQKENIKEYLQYYQDHIQLATKIDNRANILALHDLDKRYKTLEKESKIKTQQLEIQKAQTNKNYALGGIAFLAMLLGGSFWFFKNRQKTTKLATQNTLFSLQQNMRVMELQNLNQQLDSHDVKNLLGDMSSEIQEKAPDSYKKMIKFLNITKASLYRDSFTDPIEKQLQQAEDFLSLQQSSLAEPLHYHIENTLKDNQIEIPRLMLKNLVENAVKHGIKGKEGGGNITVSLTEDGHFLTIIVDDTGKGRTLKTLSNKGIGISTYQNLFATLNQKNKENAVFEMTDKKQGVKVTITIPKNYQYS